MEMLYKKYPKKNQLTEALMDLLYLEREAVYRRLRNEVTFSANEIAKIAYTWNISLDEVIGISQKESSLEVYLWDCYKPSPKVLDNMRNWVQELYNAKNLPELGYLEVTNHLPRILACGFPYINRFNLLKWMYQYVDEETPPFSKVVFEEEVAKVLADLYIASKNIANISFIFDHLLFNYLMSDIHFFSSIYLITDEEIELIKKDLYDLLNYLSEVAIKGCWPETGNKVKIYISNVNIETNYSYYYGHGNNEQLCCAHTIGKDIYTSNPTLVEDFKIWLQSKKRSSVQISETDAKSRIEFFMKQHQLIDSL